MKPGECCLEIPQEKKVSVASLLMELQDNQIILEKTETNGNLLEAEHKLLILVVLWFPKYRLELCVDLEEATPNGVESQPNWVMVVQCVWCHCRNLEYKKKKNKKKSEVIKFELNKSFDIKKTNHLVNKRYEFEFVDGLFQS